MRVPGCYRNAIFLIISCFQFLLAGDLTIAVAANARYAVDKIVQEFEKDTNIQCRLVVASSGKLSAQIRNGAPFHLFLSADTSYPTALIRDKFAEPLLHIYAHGTLVIWSKTASDSAELDAILLDPTSRIAIANPRTAPYGAAANEAWKKLQPQQDDRKFIYGSSISQVNQYVQTKAVDIGFTSQSTIYHLNETDRGYWEEIPAELYAPLAQGAVTVKGISESDHKKAEHFLQFLNGTKAIKILQTYGYRIE